jgi:hypothetical protein
MNVCSNHHLTQDKLIISTAIPEITNEFHSANDIGWYGTAFLLTNCAFLLVFGKLYTIFNVKSTFLTAVFLFEVGSAICGAAPNSIAFIIGRAISGLGAGGVQSGIVSLSPSSTHLLRLSLIAHFMVLACHYCLCCSSTKTAPISRFLWRCIWNCVCDGSTTRRCIYDESYLEMVFLHQPSLWGLDDGVCLLFAPYPGPSRHHDSETEDKAA